MNKINVHLKKICSPNSKKNVYTVIPRVYMNTYLICKYNCHDCYADKTTIWANYIVTCYRHA